MGNGVQRATQDNGVCEGGRQTCLPSQHLEGVNQGHLGIDCHRGLSNTFDREAPTTSKAPRKRVLKEQAALLREEVVSLLQKGAISSVTEKAGGFDSTIFLVPKKNGQMKTVINLKCLNQWVEAVAHHS